MRHEYARRRVAMTGVLAGGAAGRLLGDEAGMHMVLQTTRDAEEIATAAWRRGVAVATVARYFAGPVTTNGLVLGYGGAGGGEITRACRILVNLANASMPGHGRE
jgi:GntR family transcriptional regulator/MocR family aminotransferase